MAEIRQGDWMVTFTGRQFWPVDPRIEDIDIEDIARALSNICRFGGHSIRPYSVAQHSVLVSQWCPAEHALSGLLHDAAEAYIGDMVMPLKSSLPEFSKIEHRLYALIAEKFGVPAKIPPEVKKADMEILLAEKRDIMSADKHRWEVEDHFTPAPVKISPEPALSAYSQFYTRFQELSKT